MVSRNIPIDTTVKIWESLYKVTCPYQMTRSIEDIERYGTPVSGVEAVDKSVHNDWITTMKTVADMVSMFIEGVPVAIVNRGDIKTIYQDIQDHIYRWRGELEVGVNIGDAPVEELIAMDEFAQLIYNVANKEFASIEDSLIVRQLGINSTASAGNFFNPEAMAKLTTNKDTTLVVNAEEEQRDSLGDFFKSRARL